MSRQRYTIFLPLSYMLTALALLTACIDDYNVDIPTKESRRLIVEGQIRSNALCSFFISYSIPINDAKNDEFYASTVSITDAQVDVLGDDGSCFKGYRMGADYKVNVAELNPDVKYWLRIKTAEGTFESTPEQPTNTPPISQLSFTQKENGPVNITVKTAPDKQDNPLYLTWTYNEVWEIYTPFTATHTYRPYPEMRAIIPSDGEDDKTDDELQIITVDPADYTNHGWVYGYSSQYLYQSSENFENNIINTEICSIPLNSNRLQTCYRITVNQRAISKAEYEYMELRERQTHEMGGIFTPQPSELPTNIHCIDGKMKAAGYVGVSGNTTSKVLYIKQSEIQHETPYKARVYTEAEFNEMKLTSFIQRYHAGFRLFFYDDQAHTTEWTENWCIDVRDPFWGGGTLMRPESWPTGK